MPFDDIDDSVILVLRDSFYIKMKNVNMLLVK